VAQSFQSDWMPAETSEAETTTDSTKEESVEAEKSA